MLTATPVISEPVEAAEAGWIEIHPRYRAWLRKCGIATARDILALRGEVVGGHADRHVAKVELRNGVSSRGAFLKREHVVARRARFRNWRDGFGWVSRSAREAETLKALETLGLPGPQWLAHGEDAAGRAFLLVEELTDTLPLREFLSDYTMRADESRLLAERIGRLLAEYHAKGIGTPELAAKHVLVRPGTFQPNLIDWQSSRPPRTISPGDAAQWFGALQATLPGPLVSTRDRLRVLWAYRRVLRASGVTIPMRFGAFARGILAASRIQSKRSSVRQQLGASGSETARLVWLDGEAIVAIPEVATDWPARFFRQPYYDLPTGTEPVRLSCEMAGELTRFHSFAPLGWLAAALRERPWRSPGATAARVLVHLRRFGIAGPKLLAFGQRRTSPAKVESFVVADPSPGNIDELLSPSNPLRQRHLADVGHFLKRLHDAGCRFHQPLLGDRALLTATPELRVRSASSITLVRRVTERRAKADLAVALAGWDRLDKMRVLRAYLGSAAAEHTTWDRFARAVLRWR